MLSAPCTMCQAFVWHLLLARQINFKILGKKEGRRGFETVCIPLLVSILTGMTVPLSLEAVSALSTSKMLFPGLIFDLSTIRLWEERSTLCFGLGRWMKALSRKAAT